MKVINKKLVSMLCILVVVLSIGIFLICNKSSNKITLDEVKLKEPEKESGMFAIMLQSSEGSEDYTQSEDETFPKEGYTLNEEKSGCLDSNGQKISDITLNYADGKVTVETGNTSYCYIYFDIEEPMNLGKACEGQSNMGECVANQSSKLNEIQNLNNGNKGDLQYRYVGTQAQSSSINNYVCFGNTTCNGEADNHLYRIIGITSGGQLKIQKNSAIGTEQWWEDYTTDKSWADSKIYTYLKGSDFYESTTYVSQEMKNKIETGHTWNTGDATYYSSEISGLYGTKIYEEEKVTHSHKGAVGLAYLSDYYFAYDESGNTDCQIGCNSWMIPSDYNTLWKNESYEWTMSRYGLGSGYYYAWGVDSDGYVDSDDFDYANAVRPVFYLQSTATITGGEGTLTKPYIIN